MFTLDTFACSDKRGMGTPGCLKLDRGSGNICGKTTTQGTMIVMRRGCPRGGRRRIQLDLMESRGRTNLGPMRLCPLLQACKSARDQKGLEQHAHQQQAGHAA